MGRDRRTDASADASDRDGAVRMDARTGQPDRRTLRFLRIGVARTRFTGALRRARGRARPRGILPGRSSRSTCHEKCLREVCRRIVGFKLTRQHFRLGNLVDRTADEHDRRRLIQRVSWSSAIAADRRRRRWHACSVQLLEWQASPYRNVLPRRRTRAVQPSVCSCAWS